MGVEDWIGGSASTSMGAPEVPFVSSRDSVVDAQEGDAEGKGSPSAISTHEEWVLPVEHLSASSLNMLAVCPRQFQQRYILGRKEPPSQAQIVGSSFHKTMEYNYRQKISTLHDLEPDVLSDYLLDEAFPTLVEEEEQSTGQQVVWDNQDDALLSAQKMVVSYRKEVSPSVVPVEVERRFSLDVSDVPIPVVGMIDVEDSHFIIDLKTSKRRSQTIKPAWRTQGRIYQLAAPKHTQFHVVTTKGENMPKLMIPYTLAQYFSTEEWVRNLAWTANFYYSRFGEGDWPALGVVHDWRCGWCGYKQGCPAWPKGV